MFPFSVLDLSPITEGSDAGQALHNSLDLARHVEALGYRRYWMAEHHMVWSDLGKMELTKPRPCRMSRLLVCKQLRRL